VCYTAVSAFYFESPEKQMYMNASIWTRSKFMGMSIGVALIGKGVLCLICSFMCVNLKPLILLMTRKLCSTCSTMFAYMRICVDEIHDIWYFRHIHSQVTDADF